MRADELESLLGAYALDAVEDHERSELEEYLSVNPRARAEVDAHREVATFLAFSGAAAPEGLWDRISSAMDEPAPEPGPELAKILPIRRSRWPVAAIAGAAVGVAAALAAALIAVAVREPGPSRAEGDPMVQVFDRAMADPDARRVVLTSSDGGQRAVAAVEPDGVGVISLRELPDVGPDRTYQLWGVVDDRVISLGVLGHRPGVQPFTVDGGVTALVVTDEVAGGVAVSEQPPLLSGQVT